MQCSLYSLALVCDQLGQTAPVMVRLCTVAAILPLQQMHCHAYSHLVTQVFRGTDIHVKLQGVFAINCRQKRLKGGCWQFASPARISGSKIWRSRCACKLGLRFLDTAARDRYSACIPLNYLGDGYALFGCAAADCYFNGRMTELHPRPNAATRPQRHPS